MEEKDNKAKQEENCETSNVVEEEQLLGSLTTFNNVEFKGQQLRSSARVHKKMKLELTAHDVPEKVEKKEETVKQDVKKCCRPLWNSDEKTLFFEALNEFGKDFDRIQGYINHKLRKKVVSEHITKTKDQVRLLYYRTWHKISKYLKFPDEIKKIAQELYSLINYGELRKKMGSVNEKSLRKLNELIYTGTTKVSIRGKGKIFVRTPMCKALRRLNQLDEKYDEIQLPNRVTVELRPKDMISFLKVQSIAQNPRIKTELPLQKRLSTLVSCVQKKWKSVEANFYEKALNPIGSITNDCIPPSEESDRNKTLLNPPLRVTPPENCHIDLPSINISEYFKTQSICLKSYGHRVGLTTLDYDSWCHHSGFKFLNKNSNKKGARSRADSISDKSPQKLVTTTEENDVEIGENEHNSDEVLVKQEGNEQGDAEIKSEKEKQNNIDEQKQIRIQNIRKGWTEEDSESVTLGEIYLMFGLDSKLTLEYSWDKLQIKNEHSQSSVNDLTKFNENESKSHLTSALSKLLSIAKLHYRENVIRCPCGHVCGAENNAQPKKAETKIRKILTTESADAAPKNKSAPDNKHTKNMSPPVFIPPKSRPVSPASYYNQLNHSQLDSIRRLKPRYCNRRRPRSKQVVVERKLPLLPNGIGVDHQIVRMNIIKQETSNEIPKSSEQVTTSSTALLNNGNSNIKNEDPIISNSSTSPSRILGENDVPWISSEVADYSLSSLLGHLESPVKTGSSSNLIEDSRLSQDMGAQILSLLTQSSVDFSANFADLAAQVEK